MTPKDRSQEKIAFINKNKKRIINLYNKNVSISEIIKRISKNNIYIDIKDIKNKLKEWDVYNINKKQCYKGRNNINNIKYNAVYDTKYNLIKIFQYKWECRDWLISNNIVISDMQAKNIMNKSIKDNTYYKGYLFKNITKEEYNNLNKNLN